MQPKRRQKKAVKKTRRKRIGTGLAGPGRPKGKPNKVTLEVRELTQNLFDDAFWKMMYADVHNRAAHPAIVKELLYYAYGKPKERVEHSTPAEGMKFTIKIDGHGDRNI
jgi:hypothetical protein